MKKQKEAIDIGTSELSQHFKLVPRLTRGSYGYNARVMDETEIDRMLLADRISANEHSTLENLLARLHKVGFVGLKSPAYDAPIKADPSAVGDRRAHAIRGVSRLLSAMDMAMGADKRKALVNLVLIDAPWEYGDKELKECLRAMEGAMR